MSSSNCCFHACIQVFQEAGKVAWYSYLFKNFPVCCDPHSQSFSLVNKTEVDVFLELCCLFDDPVDGGNFFCGSSVFLNPVWTYGSSRFTYSWILAWKILSITLLACEISAIVQQFEYSLALPFFGIEMKTDLFQSCGHCWVFQICWHIECSTFTASSCRTWNSSAGIPSPPLALFVVMLPKAHLTSHSRMSGFQWVTTASWLCRSLNLFLM